MDAYSRFDVPRFTVAAKRTAIPDAVTPEGVYGHSRPLGVTDAKFRTEITAADSRTMLTDIVQPNRVCGHG